MKFKIAAQHALGRCTKWLAIAAWVPFACSAWSKPIDVYDLKGLIDEATQHHPSVLNLRELLRSAQSDVDYSKRQYYPEVSLNAAYHDTANTGSLIVKQHVWDGGGLKARVELARAKVDVARATLDEQMEGIAVRTLDAWRTFVLSQQKALIVEQGMAQLNDLMDSMQRRVDARVSPRVELQLVQSRLIQSQVERDALIAERDLALERLTQLTGADIEVATQTDHLLTRWAGLIQQGWSKPPAEALLRLGDQQPSVRRSRQEAAAADAEVKQQEANQWPQIFVQYQQGIGTPITNDKKLVLGMSYTPGAGLSNQSLLEAALARARAKGFVSLTTAREARENLDAKIQAIQRAEKLAASWRPSVAASESLLRSYRRQFVAGRKSWQEVLTQLHELNQGQQSLLDVQVTWVATLAELELMQSATEGPARLTDEWHKSFLAVGMGAVRQAGAEAAKAGPANAPQAVPVGNHKTRANGAIND